MLSFIQMPEGARPGFEINAIMCCDWPECPRVISDGFSHDLLLSEISAKAIAVFLNRGWHRNRMVPIEHLRAAKHDDLGNPIEWRVTEGETIIGDCCPDCAKKVLTHE